MHLLDHPDSTDVRHDDSTDARLAASATRSRPRVRAIGVAGGTLAALAVWTLAAPVLGVDLQVTPGTEQPQPVGVGPVALASLLAGLVGWGSLALLERLTRRARPVWVGLAVTVLVLSLAPTQAGVTLATTVALAAMHLAVAAVVIPVLATTSASTRQAPSTDAQH